MVEKLVIKRYNIYSGMDIKFQNISVCTDPAKITPKDFQSLAPDVILISHESMDHMDPIQVYQLQKKKNCRIYCNIAAAVDLIQYYPQDTEFIDSINVMLPGSEVVFKGIKITAAISKHCDYMLPIIFRLDYLESNYSILHCIDTLIYDDLDKISENLNLCIIPIGIAKGVSAELGIQFMNKIKSPIYVTNHFTNQNQELKRLLCDSSNDTTIGTGTKVYFTDWNESCEIDCEIYKKQNYAVSSFENKYNSMSISEIIKDLTTSSELQSDLMLLVDEFNNRKAKIIDKTILDCLSKVYLASNNECKFLILMIFTLISLHSSHIFNRNHIDRLKTDLSDKVDRSNEHLKAGLLFFMGVFSQQSARISCIDDIVSNIGLDNEHVTYWVVECLGRMSSSKSDISEVAADKLLMNIVRTPAIFASVVIRRRIFWEFHRLMKLKPSLGLMFVKYFEDGLRDTNPDVRLLACLCIGVLSRTCDILDSNLLNNFVELDHDVEDDVREIFIRSWIMIHRYHPMVAQQYTKKIANLINDTNCHVRRAASDALSL